MNSLRLCAIFLPIAQAKNQNGAADRIHLFAKNCNTARILRLDAKGLIDQLHSLYQDAQGIVRSVSTGSPLDKEKRVIDKITQRDELIKLSNDLPVVQKIVTAALATKEGIAHWRKLEQTTQLIITESWVELTQVVECMHKRIEILTSQITEEKAAIVANLLDKVEMAPDTLGIVAEYLID